jgi:predicted ABC-type ATPase
MKQVKERGWFVILTYVGVEGSNINILRVGDRVELGGHNVPRADILRRYDRSLTNLSKAAKIADRLILYDNSTDAGHQLLATIEGERKAIYVAELPAWLEKANLDL